MGGVDLLGFGVSTEVAGIGLTLSHEAGNVGTLSIEETKLKAQLNDAVSVEYSDAETLTVSVATSF